MKRILIPAAFWLLVWQIAAALVGKELLLPGPAVVAARLAALGATAAFWESAGLTLLRVFGGFAAGVVLAALLAAATAASRWADTLLAPAIRVARAVPVVSFILLVLLWVDKGQVPAVVSALMVLPVVWENTVRGIFQTDPALLELARAYRFGAGKTLRLVYVPSVRPYLVSACRTGLGLAWKSGVAAEVLCLPKIAVGTEIYRSKLYLETPDLFAWTVTVVALSLLLEWVLNKGLDRGGR
ncbi:MAG: ABC transporter permease subunit [Clostridia bacterium]|nr:ABC transporter permease subunit [Clostridia bacterium]